MQPCYSNLSSLTLQENWRVNASSFSSTPSRTQKSAPKRGLSYRTLPLLFGGQQPPAFENRASRHIWRFVKLPTTIRNLQPALKAQNWTSQQLLLRDTPWTPCQGKSPWDVSTAYLLRLPVRSICCGGTDWPIVHRKGGGSAPEALGAAGRTLESLGTAVPNVHVYCREITAVSAARR